MTEKELINKTAQVEKENFDFKKELDFYKGIVDQTNVMLHISEIVDDKYLKVIWANNNYIENCGHNIEKRNNNLKQYYKEKYIGKDNTLIAGSIQIVKRTGKSYSAIYKYYIEDKDIHSWAYTNMKPYKYDNEGNLTQVLLASVFLTSKSYNPERLADLQKEINCLKYKLILSKLSKSETDILKLLASGKSEKEIAETQSRSIHTIKTHLKNIRRKLNVTKNTELVKFAIETGIA